MTIHFLNRKSYLTVMFFAAFTLLNTLQATPTIRNQKNLQKINDAPRIEVVSAPSKGMALFSKTQFCSALGAARAWEIAHPTLLTIDVPERWASSLYQIVLTNASGHDYKTIEIVSKEIDSQGKIQLAVAWWGQGDGFELYRISEFGK